jgi:hypothetical protein
LGSERPRGHLDPCHPDHTSRKGTHRGRTSSSDRGKPENEQGLRAEPDPAAEAEATEENEDRTETHIEEELPTAADQRSAEAPGIRTEPEVVEDAKIANELAAEMASVGHTADPAISTSAVKEPREEDDGGQVWFRNKVTGRVDAVDYGSAAHGAVLRDPNLEPASKPTAAQRKADDDALGRFSTRRAEERAAQRRKAGDRG